MQQSRIKPAQILFALALGTVVANAVSAPFSFQPKSSSESTILLDSPLDRTLWQNAGFETPQATVQTWLWAMRENNIEIMHECFDPPSGAGMVKSDSLSDAARSSDVAVSFMPLGLRTIDDTTAELKFLLSGCGEEPFVHRLKQIDGKWKLEATSQATVAQW